MRKSLWLVMPILAVLALGCSKPQYYLFQQTPGAAHVAPAAEETPAPAVTLAEQLLPTEVTTVPELLASTQPLVFLPQVSALAEMPATAAPKLSKLEQAKLLVQTKRELKPLLKADKTDKAQDIHAATQSKGKSQLIALILVIFVGVAGIHRFYLGYTGIGIIQLLTGGGCGIWALIDLIRIATGDLGPADGSPYEETL